MASILIIHASFDGQSERIAERIGAHLRQLGHHTVIRPADWPVLDELIAASDAVILGGGVRFGRHARILERLARREAARLAARPNAFFSVSMAAAAPGTGHVQAAPLVEGFRRRSQWHPQHVATFAGALRYTAYNPLVRLMMWFIASATGQATDTRRDHEYTDWEAVERFARDFAAALPAARHARAA
jgi:menaquinone-dependent protoporphyrinogen oxidase